MNPAKTDAPRSPGLEQAATRAAFFAAGLALSAWAPLVPLAKARLDLDEGRLGGLLLLLGLGSMFSMPLSGGLAARFGCRRVILGAAAFAGLALPLLATAITIPVLAAALMLFGAGVGVVDVTMNVQAVVVERESGKAMMSGFHGLFSVGGIVGAGGVTGLLALGMTPLGAALAAVGVGAALLVGFARGLLPFGGEADAPAFVVPRGRVLLLGALCLVLFLAEGSVLDWSGVLLNEVRGLDKARSGLGYVAFASTMTLGRLTGDAIVRALGSVRVLFLGGLVAAAGFALAALVPLWPLAVLGYALVGAGAANAVPVLFSAAGRQTAVPGHLALAAITTMGYAGMLVGPALIGFVAHGVGLPVALLIVAAGLVGVALSARTAGAS